MAESISYRPMAALKNSGISIGTFTSWLRLALSEVDGDTKQSKWEQVCRRVANLLISEETSTKDFLAAIQFVVERLEGKPIGLELQGQIGDSPFVGIDTGDIIKRLKEVGKEISGEKKFEKEINAEGKA